MTFEGLAQRLSTFDSHSLADIAAGSVLMERVDTKYLVPASMVDELLEEIRDHFSVLSVDGRRISRYGTQYYDSPDLRFYRAHHNRAMNRFKLRCRSYVDQGTSYLEVKLKNNKGRTVKRRVEIGQPCISELSRYADFLRECGLDRVDDLIETERCDYRRAAFFCKSTGERFTIDFGLTFVDSVTSAQVVIDDIAVIELKQNSLNRDSSLSKALRRRQVRDGGFSKYCIGLCLLRGKALKANRFKATLLRMQKINGKSPGEYIHA